ncbi:MAG: hypothetical protein ACI8P2_001298 [Candidatus Latescibacterota bacterium]|jgi:hypothetical protein
MRDCLYRLVALLLLLPMGASAITPHPSNMDVIVQAIEEAVDEALGQSEIPTDASNLPVFIAAQGKHDANWLVDHVLAHRLLERGFSVAADSNKVSSEGMRFSFRILDLGITGQSGLRGSHVDRQSRVTLALRLSRESDNTVYWQDEITRLHADSIPKKQLEILQHSTYSFAQTELEEQSWSKFVEPMIVSTVLGGLIYLFFSNR